MPLSGASSCPLRSLPPDQEPGREAGDHAVHPCERAAPTRPAPRACLEEWKAVGNRASQPSRFWGLVPGRCQCSQAISKRSKKQGSNPLNELASAFLALAPHKSSNSLKRRQPSFKTQLSLEGMLLAGRSISLDTNNFFLVGLQLPPSTR